MSRLSMSLFMGVSMVFAGFNGACAMDRIDLEGRSSSDQELFQAARDGNALEVSSLLALASVQVDARGEHGFTSLHLASRAGHIDVLRVEDGAIWVWDYKPNASLEKYAATQVFFYALMLSKRTGIPLEKFRCGYFDSYNCYMFKPEEFMLKGDKDSSLR